MQQCVDHLRCSTMVADGDRECFIDRFIELTGASQHDAVWFLKENGWNVKLAAERWESERTECNSLTPSTSAELSIKLDTPGYAFVLPDLERLAPDFRVFLEKDLIEMATMRRLELSGHLNWWSSVGRKLWPLSTTGDGNCLLHAASLGMWGLHDRQLLLRNSVYEMLRKGSRKTALWRRWKLSEHFANESAGLTLSEEQWEGEWNAIVDRAAPTPRQSETSEEVYESLEVLHVFALAHVLKRPIIVVSDTVLRNASGEELAPVSFGGIYLPLECPPQQCHRSPLVLCYDSAHFSPLVTMRMDTGLQQVVPVTDKERLLLPVHFALDPGSDFTWFRDPEDNVLVKRIALSETDKLALVADYMDIVRLETRRGSLRKTTPVRNCDLDGNDGKVNGYRPSSDKKRLLNEITQQVIRALRLSPSRTHCKAIDVKTCVLESNRNQYVVAALLNPECHEYMEKMVANYMKNARERFKSLTASNGRNRISRSFSASSMSISCISKDCSQPASQSTNFLCNECFERQRAMMTSFSVTNPSMLHSQRSTVTCKSQTMPLLSTSQYITCSPDTVISDLLAEQRNRASNLPDKRTLALSSGSQQTNTSVRAIEGEDGVTLYVVGSPPNP